MQLSEALDQAITSAKAAGYKIGKITIIAKPVPGTKVAYASGSKPLAPVRGYIVVDSRFAAAGEPSEVLNTVKHELAHLIAETVNTKKKRVWHGEAWKLIHEELGGNGERYYTGAFVKPENVGKVIKTKEELAKTKATEPKETWVKGTYRQWLERGYHVIKGQKGNFVTWEFSAEEYETNADGKTSNWGRASAVYFAAEQVEAN